MRVIIIGGIAAGMSAAAKLRRADKEAEIIVFEKKDYISFGACGLPYFVGDYFTEKERMFARTKEQMESLGIQVCLQHEVLAVDEHSNQVTVKDLCDDSTRVEAYDKLLIATGASGIIPPMEHSDLANIHVLRSLEDGIDVKELFMSDKVKTVGIIGAGFIGLEVVEAAKKLGKEVHVFQISGRILREVFDPEVTELLEEELRRAGVHLHLNTQVLGFEGETQVESIRTKDASIPVDAVIIATGVRPNTSFLEGTGIERLANGAIIIDNEGKTSVENIYAAGDCATVPHLLKSEPAYIPLATTANKLGRIVGTNLAGGHEVLEGTLGSSCIKLMEIEAGRTGLTETEAKNLGYSVKTSFITDKNHTNYYPGQEKISVKLIYEADTLRLLGGQVVGKCDAVQRCNVIATAIYAKMTTKQLGMLDLCYAPPFSRTWDVLNVAGNASK
ncbi:MAG: CoA-disulfide reductase [bacterium]|nr:CoA-disulfide reductase [bacterium]